MCRPATSSHVSGPAQLRLPRGTVCHHHCMTAACHWTRFSSCWRLICSDTQERHLAAPLWRFFAILAPDIKCLIYLFTYLLTYRLTQHTLKVERGASHDGTLVWLSWHPASLHGNLRCHQDKQLVLSTLWRNNRSWRNNRRDRGRLVPNF